MNHESKAMIAGRALAGCGPYLLAPPGNGVALQSITHPTAANIVVGTHDINASSTLTEMMEAMDADPERCQVSGARLLARVSTFSREYVNGLRQTYSEMSAAQTARITALEAEITRLNRRIAAEETETPKEQSDVDRVIDQLDRRIIGSPDRQRLRKSLDKADTPDKSRRGQDAAVGRALGFATQPVGLVWRPA